MKSSIEAEKLSILEKLDDDDILIQVILRYSLEMMCTTVNSIIFKISS